ncbi:MAG: hypothetical protein OEW78_08040 [Nitrosopumilus sp.]|uniref:hypothetical protein n=1 Tax=Nitrosopumilus sp. TaxID=2024843 RepID=UPI00247021B4|nr:hypothetical protein [Nitrosopumilus sp.]MDH5431812.1 hypothetical protein [Nitrosopumilus sp.]
MVLDFGKESVSIMFAVFSIAITIFASSPEFTSDTYYDDNLKRKSNFLNISDLDSISSEQIDEAEKVLKIEKFILYNADLSLDDRKLTFNEVNVDYDASIERYKDLNLDEFSEHSKIRLKLAMIPVYYNIGDEDQSKKILQDIKDNTKIKELEKKFSLRDLLNDPEYNKSKKLSFEEEIVIRYWYSQYVLESELSEFPGCKDKIFGKVKCTHNELTLSNNLIDDLNYDSYFFDIGNKYQEDQREFYQDDIKSFFDIYMNWIIIGVFIVVMISWARITQKKDDASQRNGSDSENKKEISVDKLIRSQEKSEKNNDSARKIIAFSILGWVVTGYAFFTLIVFGNPISNSFFSSDNPVDPHYVVFSIIALSLLARFVGGMVFGRLSDLHGRLFVIKLVLTGSTIVMIFSAFLPYSGINLEFISIFFIISRVLIGFFTGGLWPTGGVYALEKLQFYYSKHKENNDEKTDKNRIKRLIKKPIRKIKGIFPITENPTQIKTLGWQSSWIQSGFQWSIMLEVTMSLIFTTIGIDFIQHGSETSLSQWPIISVIGVGLGIFSVIVSGKMSESEQWQKIRAKINPLEDLDLYQDVHDKDTRRKIVNLWLIMAGVMYLFYATMGIMGGYYTRSDYLVTECTGWCIQSLFHPIWITLISLVAHIVPGHFLSRTKWNDESKESKFLSYVNFLQKLDILLLLKKRKKYIDDGDIEAKSHDNVDARIILVHGYLVLYASAFFAVFFFIVFLLTGKTQLVNPYANWEWINFLIYPVIWIFTVSILFVVTSTWSIIPSILSSSFSIKRRNFWVSTIYTGGVIVGFAAPFVSIQIIQQHDHVWLLVPVILGTISIIIGARSFITDNLKRPGDVVIT